MLFTEGKNSKKKVASEERRNLFLVLTLYVE